MRLLKRTGDGIRRDRNDLAATGFDQATVPLGTRIYQPAEDSLAAEELVRRYYAAVYNVALRTLGRREDAEDVAQQTFLRALPHVAELRSADVAGWLYRVAANLCVDEIRRRSRRADLEFAEQSPEELVSADPFGAPEVAAELRELRLTVWRATLALPPQQRLALALREWHGMSYTDIATAMSTTTSAVETLLFRARQGFRRTYRRLIDEPTGDEAGCAWYLGRLSASVDGELSPKEQRAVDAHLAGCPGCEFVSHELRATNRLYALIPLMAPSLEAEAAALAVLCGAAVAGGGAIGTAAGALISGGSVGSIGGAGTITGVGGIAAVFGSAKSGVIAAAVAWIVATAAPAVIDGPTTPLDVRAEISARLADVWTVAYAAPAAEDGVPARATGRAGEEPTVAVLGTPQQRAPQAAAAEQGQGLDERGPHGGAGQEGQPAQDQAGQDRQPAQDQAGEDQAAIGQQDQAAVGQRDQAAVGQQQGQAGRDEAGQAGQDQAAVEHEHGQPGQDQAGSDQTPLGQDHAQTDRPGLIEQQHDSALGQQQHESALDQQQHQPSAGQQNEPEQAPQAPVQAGAQGQSQLDSPPLETPGHAPVEHHAQGPHDQAQSDQTARDEHEGEAELEAVQRAPGEHVQALQPLTPRPVPHLEQGGQPAPGQNVRGESQGEAELDAMQRTSGPHVDEQEPLATRPPAQHPEEGGQPAPGQNVRGESQGVAELDAMQRTSGPHVDGQGPLAGRSVQAQQQLAQPQAQVAVLGEQTQREAQQLGPGDKPARQRSEMQNGTGQGAPEQALSDRGHQEVVRSETPGGRPPSPGGPDGRSPASLQPAVDGAGAPDTSDQAAARVLRGGVDAEARQADRALARVSPPTFAQTKSQAPATDAAQAQSATQRSNSAPSATDTPRASGSGEQGASTQSHAAPRDAPQGSN